MNRLSQWSAGSSMALAVLLGFTACGSPFSSDAVGGPGSDAETGDGNVGDGPGPGPDGTTDARGDGTIEGSVIDAGGDRALEAAPPAEAGPCQGAFAPPTLVLAHTSSDLVDSITLSIDELDAYVALMPAGATTEQRTVYAMHRASAAVPFVMDKSNPLSLTNTGPTPGAFDVGLSADDLRLYFSHRQDSDAGMLGVNIYVATRGDGGGTFSGGSELGMGINDPATNQFHAHPAGPNLYFTVAVLVSGAQGPRSLYVSPLSAGIRTPIVELNAAPPAQEGNPVPSRDEEEIFFASDRASPGANSLVYTAHRASAGGTFSTPILVDLSTAAGVNVTPQHLTLDRCRLYVLEGQQDAYVSQRAAQ